MDFITHFPHYCGHNAVFTLVYHFSKYIIFKPFSISSTALDLPKFFYNNIVCRFFMPMEIISDRDSRFFASFW